MRTERLTLYAPHSGQLPFHESRARFRVAVCGRRWGKTKACVNEMLDALWQRAGTRAFWVAPTYQQTKVAFRMIRDSVPGVIEKANSSQFHIELVNGSTIDMRSAENPDNLRGDSVHILVLDECARIAREAWEAVLRPMLTDTRGRALFISTPFGRNWFHELFTRGSDPLHRDWASFNFPSRTNPYLYGDDDDERAVLEGKAIRHTDLVTREVFYEQIAPYDWEPFEITAARREMPQDTFRQEYEAEFLEDGAGVFRNIRGCVRGALEGPQPGHTYVIGYDPAKRADFGVVFVLDVARMQVVAYDRWQGVNYEVQIQRVYDLARGYNNARVCVDSTPGSVGDPIHERLVQSGVTANGFAFTNTTKNALVEHLAMLIQSGAVGYPDLPVLLHELSVFQYEMTASGNVRYKAPEGYHDDTVCALALAAWEARHGSGLVSYYREEVERMRDEIERRVVATGREVPPSVREALRALAEGRPLAA